MNAANDLLDKYNVTVATVATLMTAIFGQFWYLFAILLLLNILDWITGTYKARKLQTESSEAGLKGLGKKVVSWVIVILGFAVPVFLMGIGAILGVDLSFVGLLGWFVLSAMAINEARSIAENLVEAGYNVPPILTKGLAVTAKLLAKKGEALLPDVPEEVRKL